MSDAVYLYYGDEVFVFCELTLRRSKEAVLHRSQKPYPAIHSAFSHDVLNYHLFPEFLVALVIFGEEGLVKRGASQMFERVAHLRCIME